MSWRLFATHTYIFSTRTLGALAYSEGHLLAFAEVVEVCSINGRTVKEHVVVAVLGRDEAKSFVSDSFDRTLFHFSNPILFKIVVSVRVTQNVRAIRPDTVVVNNIAGSSDNLLERLCYPSSSAGESSIGVCAKFSSSD